VIGTDEHRVVTETVAALCRDPDIYQRGGMLVRTQRDVMLHDGVTRPIGSPTIINVPLANLRERLTDVAVFTKEVKGEKGKVQFPVHPSKWLVDAVAARGEWVGIRPLHGVSEIPVLRKDGSVWATPGYDPDTGVLFVPSADFPPIPQNPSTAQIQAALSALLEVVCRFSLRGAGASCCMAVPAY